MARKRRRMPPAVRAELCIMLALCGALIWLLHSRGLLERQPRPAAPVETAQPYMEYGPDTGPEIDPSGFVSPDTKNNQDLVAYARQAWQHQWGYVWGTFGDVFTEELFAYKLEQYPEGVGKFEEFIRQNWLGRRTADCVGLIKSYGWFDPASGAIGYDINGMPDCDTEDMFAAAVEKGPVSTIPELPGLLVYREGHVGVYIGGGYVIEAYGTKEGVVKTKLAERPFTHWMKCPYIEYIEG